jgi:predicted DsbA family dithiol-disulfide isomerase
MVLARASIVFGSILCGSSVQAFPKTNLHILRGTSSSKVWTVAAVKMSSDNNNNSKAGCEDGVCRPLDADGSKNRPDRTTTTTQTPNAETTNQIKMEINIISDTMCPWCWVGKRNMEQALQEMPEMDVEIHWLPFFLDRKLPEEGKPVEEYYVGNYGDPKAGERMMPGLIQAGRKCGIDFETHYVKMTRYRPTIRSHRLIHLAKRQNKQDEMVEALFHMYYEEGKHLNSIEHLTEAASKVGLEGDIAAYLKSDQDEKEVFDEAEKALQYAEGVPTFLFTKPGTDLHHSFSGGQPPIAFRKVFKAFSERG